MVVESPFTGHGRHGRCRLLLRRERQSPTVLWRCLFGGMAGKEKICFGWRFVKAGAFSGREDQASGREIALRPGSRVISASGEFPGTQLTNWGALGVL